MHRNPNQGLTTLAALAAILLLAALTLTPAATDLHRDGLSSVRAITDAAGVKIEAALYTPLGEQSDWAHIRPPHRAITKVHRKSS